jgi:hypothetical protein
MITKFEKFLESNYTEPLLYYAFDWDDNILVMPTVIHMEKNVGGEWVEVDVSTSEFAKVRNDENYRILDNDPVKAFSEFKDNGPRGISAFLEDTKKAIEQGKYGPSWDDFTECLTSGSLFAIITARGHESEGLRLGIEWIIDNVLTETEINEMYQNLRKFKYLFKLETESERILKGKPSENKLVKKYLDNCDLIGVSAPSREGSASNPEKAKELALLSFKSKINSFAEQLGTVAKIGFSDDDLGNVKHIEDLIDNLHHEKFPNIVHYVVKGTTDPENITKKVKVKESAHQSPGMASSVMPHDNFNNMTNRLHPKDALTKDDAFHHDFLRKSDKLAKMSKEILSKKKKK